MSFTQRVKAGNLDPSAALQVIAMETSDRTKAPPGSPKDRIADLDAVVIRPMSQQPTMERKQSAIDNIDSVSLVLDRKPLPVERRSNPISDLEALSLRGQRDTIQVPRNISPVSDITAVNMNLARESTLATRKISPITDVDVVAYQMPRQVQPTLPQNAPVKNMDAVFVTLRKDQSVVVPKAALISDINATEYAAKQEQRISDRIANPVADMDSIRTEKEVPKQAERRSSPITNWEAAEPVPTSLRPVEERNTRPIENMQEVFKETTRIVRPTRELEQEKIIPIDASETMKIVIKGIEETRTPIAVPMEEEKKGLGKLLRRGHYGN